MGGNALSADAPDAPSASASWALPGIPARKTSVLSLVELKQRWNSFSPAPANTNGYNALLLPLHVPADATPEIRSLANSLAFLVSFDLDWADQSYNARHAYFVFKRSKVMPLMQQQPYDPKVTAGLVNQWNATHAIGGELAGTDAQHLTATIQLLGRDGKTITEHHYATPQSFHTLLGDISADCLKDLGYKPSEKLITYLHLPRCTQTQSLVLLGNAAFAAEDSPEEFDAYRQILKIDPDFAEVRYWWSNQNYWTTQDRVSYQGEKIRALQARLVPSAFEDLDEQPLTAQQLMARDQWSRQIEELTGPSTPMLLAFQVRAGFEKMDFTPTFCDNLLATCSRYPNNHQLLDTTATLLTVLDAKGALDFDMATSLELSILLSKAMPGTGDQHVASNAGYFLNSMGYHEQAADVLLQSEYGLKDVQGQRHLLSALFAMGRFDEVVQHGQKFRKNSTPEPMSVFYEAAANALLGDAAACRQLRTQYQAAIESLHLLPILDAYEKAAQGQPVDLNALVTPQETESQDSANQAAICHLLLAARQNARSPKDQQVTSVAIGNCMNNRLMAIALAEYSKNCNAHEYDGMRQAWAWLHPDDPVVTYWKDKNYPTQSRPWPVQDVLAPFEPTRYPKMDPTKTQAAMAAFGQAPSFAYVITCQELVAAGQPDKAMEVARKYRHAMTCLPLLPDARVFANHLVYEVHRSIVAARAKQK